MLKNPLPEFAEDYALSPRPSKTRLHRLLKNDLEETNDKEVVADIAAQNFMNARFFKTHVYLGVDIDDKALKNGVDSMDEYNCETDFISAPVSEDQISAFTSKETKQKVAIKRNILNHNLFPSNSIDIIASTNTLIRNHIDPIEYYSVVQSFCDYIDEGGHMYLNMADDDLTNEIHRYLSSEFAEVEVIPYNNKISDKWEKFLESENGSLSLADNKILLYGQYAVTLFLSKVELIYSENARMSYIRCKRKL